MPASCEKVVYSGSTQGHRQSRFAVITHFLIAWLDAEECEDVVEAATNFPGVVGLCVRVVGGGYRGGTVNLFGLTSGGDHSVRG
jgi:hypothetical protein